MPLFQILETIRTKVGAVNLDSTQSFRDAYHHIQMCITQTQDKSPRSQLYFFQDNLATHNYSKEEIAEFKARFERITAAAESVLLVLDVKFDDIDYLFAEAEVLLDANPETTQEQRTLLRGLEDKIKELKQKLENESWFFVQKLDEGTGVLNRLLSYADDKSPKTNPQQEEPLDVKAMLTRWRESNQCILESFATLEQWTADKVSKLKQFVMNVKENFEQEKPWSEFQKLLSEFNSLKQELVHSSARRELFDKNMRVRVMAQPITDSLTNDLALHKVTLQKLLEDKNPLVASFCEEQAALQHKGNEKYWDTLFLQIKTALIEAIQVATHVSCLKDEIVRREQAPSSSLSPC
jgi:hypothetical protein